MKGKFYLGFFFGILGLAGFASAYNSLLGYYRNPVDLLVQSEWIRFILLFGIFYAVIFFSVKGMMPGKNRGVAIVISICLSLLITIALAERGLIYGYFGEDLSSWVLFIAFILLLAFIIRAAYKNFGPKFTAFTLLFLWAVFAFYFEPEDLINSGSAGDLMSLLYNLWISVWGFVVTAMIALALLFKKARNILTRDFGHLATGP